MEEARLFFCYGFVFFGKQLLILLTRYNRTSVQKTLSKLVILQVSIILERYEGENLCLLTPIYFIHHFWNFRFHYFHSIFIIKFIN